MKEIGFSKDAKLEFNVNVGGVAVVGNAEGYLALARFCTQLAERSIELRRSEPADASDTIRGEGEYHLAEYVAKKAISEGRFVFSPGPLAQYLPIDEFDTVQDVLFYVADNVGSKFWLSEDLTGALPEWLERSIAFGYEGDDQEC